MFNIFTWPNLGLSLAFMKVKPHIATQTQVYHKQTKPVTEVVCPPRLTHSHNANTKSVTHTQ